MTLSKDDKQTLSYRLDIVPNASDDGKPQVMLSPLQVSDYMIMVYGLKPGEFTVKYTKAVNGGQK